jgi:hypothetical protein
MKLEELFLKKEELPILYETCFQVPIHPRLLRNNIKINETIAQRIFLDVAKEWYNDLKKYVETENPENKEWINEVFLKEEPKITKMPNRQFFNYWEDYIQTNENGLVTCFSISRNAGGSLYFDKDEMNCESFGKLYIKFSEEKIKEFRFEEKFNKSFCYAGTNIDSYPGALFLRNWAIKYMNEVFKQVF